VDDHETNRKLLAYLLTSNGYLVDLASDARSALAALHRDRPDLVLIDIQLADGDGLDVARRIRADAAMRSVVIIAITAYAMRGDEARALANGCDAYLTKPIDTRTLPTLIRGYLTRTP
jgi:two-component system cell cycle response regulator DivK